MVRLVSLALADWPEFDRALWARLTAIDGPLEDSGALSICAAQACPVCGRVMIAGCTGSFPAIMARKMKRRKCARRLNG